MCLAVRVVSGRVAVPLTAVAEAVAHAGCPPSPLYSSAGCMTPAARVCRRLAPSAAGSAGGNPHCTLLPFRGVGVQHGSGEAACFALYQGVFVTGHQPMWLLAHRDTYRVHYMDNREASSGSAAPTAVPVAGMAAWNRRDPGAKDTAQAHSFVVATGVANACELRFCRMPINVRRPCSPVPDDWGCAMPHRPRCRDCANLPALFCNQGRSILSACHSRRSCGLPVS